MVTKGNLGVSYIIAVGIGLFGSLVSGWLLPLDPNGITIDSNSILAMFSGLTVALGFTLTGLGLANSELDGDRVWRVAKWGTLGLGIPTALALLLGMYFRDSLVGLGWRNVAMINIAGGGVVGILIGAITELRAEHERTTKLNQRNTVFLRLFRHDIRTSVNILRGYLELIVSEEVPTGRSVETVHNQIDHILRLSDAARQLDDLQATTREPVDLAALTRDRLDAHQRTYPDAEFERNVPETTYVRANDLLPSVVDNLIRNAVEHSDSHPRVRVSVAPGEDSGAPVVFRVRDDGPGFSTDELDVHSRETETDLRHSNGIGLWLTRWIVESYGGELRIENAPAGGAVVTVVLPRAEPEDASQEPDERVSEPA